jgi:cytochrome c-type biogenesis protein CcmE
MKRITLPVAAAALLTLAACGSNFEWFPASSDTTVPTVSAQVANSTTGGTISASFTNRTTHVSALPASVTFIADEAATIYYTTNGNSPTTSSSSVNITASGGVAVSNIITATNTILKFFGIDTAGNQSATLSSTVVSP